MDHNTVHHQIGCTAACTGTWLSTVRITEETHTSVHACTWAHTHIHTHTHTRIHTPCVHWGSVAARHPPKEVRARVGSQGPLNPVSNVYVFVCVCAQVYVGIRGQISAHVVNRTI